MLGVAAEDGAVVGYEYAAGWIWEIEISVEEGALALVMSNGVPEREDGPAQRYEVLRGNWF